jgi:hypothetical protein
MGLGDLVVGVLDGIIADVCIGNILDWLELEVGGERLAVNGEVAVGLEEVPVSLV